MYVMLFYLLGLWLLLYVIMFVVSLIRPYGLPDPVKVILFIYILSASVSA